MNMQTSAQSGELAWDQQRFNEPEGPTAECFSARQMVLMLEVGLSPDEFGHAIECEACRTGLACFCAQENRVALYLSGDEPGEPCLLPGRVTLQLIGDAATLKGLVPSGLQLTGIAEGREISDSVNESWDESVRQNVRTLSADHVQFSADAPAEKRAIASRVPVEDFVYLVSTQHGLEDAVVGRANLTAESHAH